VTCYHAMNSHGHQNEVARRSVLRAQSYKNRRPINNPELISSLIKILPTVLILLFAVWVILRYDCVIRYVLAPRISGVELFGVKLTVAEQSLDSLTKQSPSPQSGEAAKRLPITQAQKDQIFQRAKHLAPILTHGRILWLDDNPQFNIRERNFLESLGISVDCAENNSIAHKLFNDQNQNGTPYDLIISDVDRDNLPGKTPGIDFLKELRGEGIKTDVIFFTVYAGPKPADAFGLTTSSADLLQYTFDVLQRVVKCGCESPVAGTGKCLSEFTAGCPGQPIN
jgi:CheY-like chemotaxis protein